tara:strand:- start:82 stop:222 length:141 start_codon:yes stop_codon:yes gene_type:complete
MFLKARNIPVVGKFAFGPLMPLLRGEIRRKGIVLRLVDDKAAEENS